MEKQKIDLQFPVGGVVRAAPYRNQDPQTTVEAVNVRPYEVFEGRARGGSRPGLRLVSPTAASTPIRMLNSINVKTNDKLDFWEDSFDYSDASHYSALAVDFAADGKPNFEKGRFYADYVASGAAYSVAINPVSNFDSTQGFRFGAFFRAENGATDGQFQLVFCTASTPAIAAYRYAFISIGPTTAVNWDIGDQSGSFGSGSTINSGAHEGWMEVEVSGTSASIYWRGSLIGTATMSSTVGSTKTGLGVSFAATATSGGSISMEAVRLQFHRSGAYELLRPRLAYSQSGKIYQDSYFSKFAESSATSGGTQSLVSDRQIMSVERGGKLYIADHGEPIAYGTDGVISGTTSFDSASYSNWTTTFTGSNKADMVVTFPAAGTTTTYNDANGNRASIPIQIRMTVTHGTVTLYTTSGLSFSIGDGYLDSKMEFSGSPSAVTAALNGLVYYPEASWAGTSIISVARLVDGEVVENSDTSFTSTGSSKTFSSGLGNQITYPENSSLPLQIRLSVEHGTLTLASTTGCTFIKGTGTNDAVMLFTAKPSDADTAMNGMYHTPETNWIGLFKLTVERLVRWQTVESYEVLSNVGQGRTPQAAITTVAAGNLTIPASANGTGLTFRIERCPKIYDPLADTLTRWAAHDGFVPIGCSMITRYRDRIVLAGDPIDPNEYYMSRQGDPNDWLYTDVDVGAALRGSNSDAGKIGDAITALMAFNDDYMFFGCRSSLWLLRGDIAGGGKIASVSRTVGVLDRFSWCTGPNGEIIWLSRDGIWMTNPECMTCQPVAVSRDLLPRELINVNPKLYTVTMAFDLKMRGVNIYLTPNTSSTSVMPSGVRHWFLSWPTKTFFEEEFATKALNPVATLPYSGISSEDTCVLLGGYGGGIYRYDNDSTTDDGTAFSSYVKLGPLQLGDGMKDALVCEIRGTLGTESEDVAWELHAASKGEDVALSSTARETGTFQAAQRDSSYPRANCESALVKLTGTAPWSMESVSLVVAKGGKARADT